VRVGSSMKPLKGYLFRAVFDWAVDNGYTPHVVVDARQPGVQVPARYVENGRIVLNIHPRAVQGYSQDDEWLRFVARFGGVSHAIEVPMQAVLAIYARENGQGVSFPPPGPDEPEADRDKAAPSGPQDEPPSPPPRGKRPTLKIVK
jgi:stringent starvation protein B